VQTGSGAHTASNSIGTWGVLRGSEVAGSIGDHSLPPGATLKEEWRYAFNPSYAFMARIQTNFLKKILRCVFRLSSYTYRRMLAVVNNSPTTQFSNNLGATRKFYAL